MGYCKSILICGGDMRQKHMYTGMKKDGFLIKACGLGVENEVKKEDIGKFDVIILPVPVSRDGEALNAPLVDYEIKISEVLSRLSPSQLVIGGMCGNIDYPMVDCYKTESVLMKNAVLTAEGALYTAMENCDFSIRGSKALIVGYGRIGKTLAELLKSVGARVTVTARKAADLALAEAMSHKAVRTSAVGDICGNYDIIFNTVPQTVIDSEILGKIPKSTLLIELASKPYGIDMEAARLLERRVIIASGLPGKLTPRTAGEILIEEITRILETEV